MGEQSSTKHYYFCHCRTILGYWTFDNIESENNGGKNHNWVLEKLCLYSTIFSQPFNAKMYQSERAYAISYSFVFAFSKECKFHPWPIKTLTCVLIGSGTVMSMGKFAVLPSHFVFENLQNFSVVWVSSVEFFIHLFSSNSFICFKYKIDYYYRF